MGMTLGEILLSPVKRFFKKTFSQAAEINRKYAKPQIKASKAVTFSLIMLRLYLILLIAILFYKFYITVVK
jgi:hypothetical protein